MDIIKNNIDDFNNWHEECQGKVVKTVEQALISIKMHDYPLMRPNPECEILFSCGKDVFYGYYSDLEKEFMGFQPNIGMEKIYNVEKWIYLTNFKVL